MHNVTERRTQFNDCLDEASLMFNPEMVERLSFGLLNRTAATARALCAAVRVQSNVTASTNTRKSSTLGRKGDARRASLATIVRERIECGQMNFKKLSREEQTLERLASAEYSLVAIVKFWAEAEPIFKGARPHRLFAFFVLLAFKQITDSTYRICNNARGEQGARVISADLRRAI